MNSPHDNSPTHILPAPEGAGYQRMTTLWPHRRLESSSLATHVGASARLLDRGVRR